MRTYLTFLLMLVSTGIFSQKQVLISKTTEKITIDGVLNEKAWSTLNVADHFLNQWPKDTGEAALKTIARITYDEDFLYVGITCYDISNEHVIQTLKRDQDDAHFNSDGIAIVLDPFNQKTNGFFFGVNAGGAQVEGLISVSGNESFINENWDNKWFSEVSYGENVWYVEMAIPFRTLRFDPNQSSWGLNFVRNDMKNNYYYSWNRVPVNFNTINLGYTGEMIWTEKPSNTKKGNVNLIPYVLGSFDKDYQNDEAINYELQAGLDAKVALSPSLNLDVTVNPDFSTVDVDRQQTNLTRFPLFFPERRGFFLENSDLFTSFGIGSINPFFSRRIGLNVPVNFGVRLSGNVSEKLRLGVMDIQTGSGEGVNPQNYFVSTLSQRVGARSTMDVLFVNRQSTSNKQNPSENAFNRVLALEYNYLDKLGKWNANVGFHKSFNPGELKSETYFTTTLRYQTKRLLTRFTGHRVGDNYLTDVGFVRRLENFDAATNTTVRRGFYQLGYLLVYDFFPKKKSSIFNLHGPRFSTTYILNLDGSLNGSFEGLFYFANFKNQSALEVKITQDRDHLPFDSFIVGSVPFPKDNYKYLRYGFWYRFDPRKKLSGSVGATFGEFFNGQRSFYEARMNYRIQPWGNFAINYEYNDIQLPDGFDSQDVHLAGVTSEISFSNKMFWTTFVQLNTQNDNININSRFQWRYAPMSDLFIVYSDNYLPNTLQVKNRALVCKLVYWF